MTSTKSSPLPTLFGPRVALAAPNIESETSETIQIPAHIKGQDFEIGEVVQVGDMRLRHDHKVPDLNEPDPEDRSDLPSTPMMRAMNGPAKVKAVPYVEVGDLVLFQIPNNIRRTSTYRVAQHFGGRKFHVGMQGDLIGILGKVESTVRLSIENFTIAGDFVLLDYFTERNSSIILPDNLTDLEEIRFKVLQKGKGVVDSRYEVGDEVYVERSKANPIFLSGKEYVFIMKDWIYGRDEGPKAPPRAEPPTNPAEKSSLIL